MSRVRTSSTHARASWSEKLAWGIGTALLLSYGGARLWLDDSSERAVASFRQMREAQSVEPANPQVVPPAVLALESTRETSLQVSAPDTALWSPGRKRAFEQVLAPAQEMPLAILRVDDLGLEVPVYSSTDEWNLNRGAGWIEGTSPIGHSGNVGVAAHRDGYFRALQDVELGQRLVLETLSGAIEYRITGVRIVAPEAVDVLAQTQHDSITLVTCYPFYYVGPAPQRFIVTAERIDSSVTVVAAMGGAGS